MISIRNGKLIRDLGLCAVAAIVSATAVRAELIVALPDIVGTYDNNTVQGGVDIPYAEGTADARVVLVGSQGAGARAPSDDCPPSDPYGIGSILALTLQLGDAELQLAGGCTIPPEDGPFTVEFALHGTEPPYPAPERLGGSYTYEFHVLPDLWCGPAISLPVVTIESAVIHSPAGVGAQGTTWGAVKGLFR